MKILIVSATIAELSPLKKQLKVADNIDSANFGKLQLDFLVSGVGMTATAFALGKQLQKKQYDLAINIGIAGAFNRFLQLGEVVEVQSDFIAELGAEDDLDFINIHKLGLIGENEFPYENGRIYASATNLPKHTLKKINGITVNKVHGNESSIAKFQENFEAAVESMEGAAFFYACRMMAVDCIQFRSISNYVEKRDKSNWKIELALNNLTVEVNNFLKKYNEDHTNRLFSLSK